MQIIPLSMSELRSLMSDSAPKRITLATISSADLFYIMYGEVSKELYLLNDRMYHALNIKPSEIGNLFNGDCEDDDDAIDYIITGNLVLHADEIERAIKEAREDIAALAKVAKLGHIGSCHKIPEK